MKIEERIFDIIHDNINNSSNSTFDYACNKTADETAKAIVELFDKVLNDFLHELSVVKKLDLRNLSSNYKAQLIIDYLKDK